MGHVEKRRPAGRACVEDLEDRLKKSVQVHCGPHIAVEHQGFIPVVPPPVGRSARERHPLSRAYGELATVEHSRQRAGSDDPFFILRDVKMERRPRFDASDHKRVARGYSHVGRIDRASK